MRPSNGRRRNSPNEFTPKVSMNKKKAQCVPAAISTQRWAISKSKYTAKRTTLTSLVTPRNSLENWSSIIEGLTVRWALSSPRCWRWQQSEKASFSRWAQKLTWTSSDAEIYQLFSKSRNPLLKWFALQLHQKEPGERSNSCLRNRLTNERVQKLDFIYKNCVLLDQMKCS